MRTRVTIEYLDPVLDGAVLEPTVLDFDDLHILQQRPVHKEFNAMGECILMIPDRMTTTVLTGHTIKPVSPSA